jgi:hypothetical protein
MSRDFEMVFPMNSSKMTLSTKGPIIAQRMPVLHRLVVSERPGKQRCEAVQSGFGGWLIPIDFPRQFPLSLTEGGGCA